MTAAVTIGGVEMLHLRYFVAVAEELSFTRAARRLHMATSPLSRRIQDLERELGAALFVRTSRRVGLTEAGRRLLPEARELVDRFDGLAAGLADAVPIPTAVIGIAPDVPATLRTRLLAALGGPATPDAAGRPDARVGPDVSVEPDGVGRPDALEVTLRPDSTAPLLRAVRDGDVDLAVVHGPVSGAGFGQVTLESHEVRVAVGLGLGFDDRDDVRLAELSGLPYASIEHDAAPELYAGTDRLLRRAGVRRRLTVAGHNLAGLAHVVATGRAFTLVSPLGASGRAFTGEPVRLLTVAGAPLSISTVAVWSHARAAAHDPIVTTLSAAASTLAPE